MATPSKLELILRKNRLELSDLQGKSKVWFDGQVRSMTSIATRRPNSIMQGDNANKGTRIIPGNLYMFIYDPKHKETLPYYDTFPLVFPFKQVKGGFYGLNMHYLPYMLRAKLLDRLLEFRNNTAMDESTRLKFSWSMINGMSQFAPAQACVKHYLYPYVRSQFKAVHASDWATAMLLPVEQFQKASTAQVWRDSTRITRGR